MAFLIKLNNKLLKYNVPGYVCGVWFLFLKFALEDDACKWGSKWNYFL